MKVRSISFRSDEFRHQLSRAGANDLAAVIGSAASLLELLAALRNAVHGTGLSPLGYHEPNKPEASLVRAHEDADVVLSSARALSSPADFGIRTVHGVTLEPYQCARQLTALALQLVDQVMSATEIAKILEGMALDESLLDKTHATNGRMDIERISALG